MPRALEVRVAKLEEGLGAPGVYTTVILRHLGLGATPDPTPIRHASGRVLVVHEGFEHLARDLMRSTGEIQ
jgi:hypothetical protein